jgi:hypothetical protein
MCDDPDSHSFVFANLFDIFLALLLASKSLSYYTTYYMVISPFGYLEKGSLLVHLQGMLRAI